MATTRLPTPVPDVRDVSEESIAQIVKEAARLYVTSMQVRSLEAGLQLGHLTLLRVLWFHDGLTQRELSKLAGIAQPTATVALRAMEELGYVVRERREDNRKNVFVYLQPEGRRLRRLIEPVAAEINEVAVAGMKKSEVQQVRHLLLQIIENLREHLEEHRVSRRTRALRAVRKAAA